MVDAAGANDKPIVLITGISGYLGSHIALTFLTDGRYKVRGTVRDKNNQAKLDPLRSAFGNELFDQMELVEADLTNDEQMKSAVQGATYVVHSASPFFFGNSEAELVTPAVEGTKSIMQACKDNGVKRCVVTSSIASLIYPMERPADNLYTDKTWSDVNNPAMGMYPKSKLFAERAAWDFVEALPEAERFELVLVLPGFILGPALRMESSVSIDFCKKMLSGEMKEIAYRNFPIIDVRDCAMSHLKAITEAGAAGKRLICVNDSVWFKDLVMPVAERFGPEGWPVPT